MSRNDGQAEATGGLAALVAATQAEPGRKIINRQYNRRVVEPNIARYEGGMKRFRNLGKGPAPEGGWANNDQSLTRGAARRQERSARTAGQKKIQGKIDSLRAARNRGLISGKQRLAFQVGAGTLGAAGLYHGARRGAVQKYSREQVDRAAIGAAGGSLVHQGSYIPTKIADNRAERKIKGNKALEAKVKAHRAQYDVSGAKPGDPRWKPHFRNYPTDVPGGKLKRVLSYTHGGKTGTLVGAGTIAGGALLGAHSTRSKVEKGGRSFAAVGALTGGGGLTTAGYLKGKEQDEAARVAAMGTVGGWAGQGAYQGAGYAAKWRAQAKHEPKTTRSQRDKALKPVKREHGAYTPAMERNYPKQLPEAKTHRVLGWTHRGRTGTALGTAATGAGTLIALKATEKKKKIVAKAEYGEQKKRVQPLRATQAAVGISLLSYGGSRSGVLRAALKHGAKKPGNAGINARRAERARQGVENVTGRGSAMLGRRLNTGFKLRPIEATVVGGALTYHALPVRSEKFIPVQQGW